MRPLFALLLFALPTVAAPVPKALKANATLDGVWQVVVMSNSGKAPAPTTMFWRIDGGRMSLGKKTAAETAESLGRFTLRRRDGDDPRLYDMVSDDKAVHSAVFELDGDTLRWGWVANGSKTITECKPAEGVYYYEMKRVKDEK